MADLTNRRVIITTRAKSERTYTGWLDRIAHRGEHTWADFAGGESILLVKYTLEGETPVGTNDFGTSLDHVRAVGAFRQQYTPPFDGADL